MFSAKGTIKGSALCPRTAPSSFAVKDLRHLPLRPALGRKCGFPRWRKNESGPLQTCRSPRIVAFALRCVSMSSVGSKSKRVATPASTGGAGTFFEQHVDTAFLTLLLVRGIPPILTDCSVTEVHIQTERSGWNTDDVLDVGENGAGRRRRLIGQVKRTFTVPWHALLEVAQIHALRLGNGKVFSTRDCRVPSFPP